ncbi:MAG: hypothetical protein ACXWJW_09865 [Xanthobacteraceae bacterium]
MDFAHTVRFSLIAAVSCITIFIANQNAQAQPTDAQRSAIRSACRSDYMANCSSVTPGGVEALQCLQRNEAKLSGACRSAVNAISAKPAEPPAAAAPAPAAAPKAATAPAETPAEVPAKPATAAAPPSPAAQGTAPVKRTKTTSKPSVIAPAPAAAAVTGPPPAPPPLPLADIPPRFELAVVRSCRAETRTICALPAGGGRILNCLAANQATVSPACSLALDRARAAAR